MKYVVSKVIDKKQRDPRRPRIRKKFEGRRVITINKNVTRKKAESRAPQHTHEPEKDVGPGVLIVAILIRPFQVCPKSLDRNKKCKKRDRNYCWPPYLHGSKSFPENQNYSSIK